MLVAIKSRFPKADLLFFGDFNFPLIDLASLSFEGSHTSAEFIETRLTFNLTQMVQKLTRSSTIIDIVLTASPDLVKSIQLCEGVSDRRILHVNLSLPLVVKKTNSLNYPRF